MPRRIQYYGTNEFYHLFNRGLDRRQIFLSPTYYKRMISTLDFYKYHNLPIKLSSFLRYSHLQKQEFMMSLPRYSKTVTILCYALMPNHFHFLVRQEQNKGISEFMSNIQNSYTRFFNTKKNRTGVLVDTQFKAVHIETDEQLLHVSRYIHINPYEAFLVKDMNQLLEYPWTSLQEYLEKTDKFICDTNIVKSLVPDYQTFVTDQTDYKKKFHMYQHLTFET